MRRILARGRAVAAVTGLFFIGPAAEGQAPVPGRPAQAQQASPYSAANTARPIHDAARPLEIDVELAWLSDPVTFTCRLAAKQGAAGLEVSGFVPTELVRERALKLARQHCDRPVVDRLQVHGGMAAHCPPASADELRPAVDEALKSVAAKLSGVRVEYRPMGQVVLAGATGSYEDKLAVSQALRNVPGCRSVVNQLQVAGVPVPVMAARPGPVQHVPGKTVTAPARPSDFAKGPALPLPGAPVARTETQRPAPGSPPVQQATFHTMNKTPVESGPTFPKFESGRPTHLPVADSQAARPQTMKPVQPLLPVLQRPSERPGQAPAVVSAAQKPAAQTVASKPPPPAPVQGTLVAKASPPPAAVLRPVQPAVKPGEPYVSSGVVLIDAEPPVPPVPQAVQSPAVVRIRQAVERACAGKGQDYEVSMPGDGSLVVRMRANNKADADTCARRVLDLPEIEPHKPRLRLAITMPD